MADIALDIRADDDSDNDIDDDVLSSNSSSSSSSSSGAVQRSATLRREQGQVMLAFNELSYGVEMGSGMPCRRKTKVKTLIEGVSGMVRAGEVLALMGGSGSGKTTLLNVLSLRITDSKNLNGVLQHRGAVRKRLSTAEAAYVMQTDVALPNLTVRETLDYAAQLRLTAEQNTAEHRAEAVQSIIDELGLSHCADTRVGSELVRGISGGELRRLSIGCELINDPVLLFLDEPTSGLDSSAAYNLVRLLRNLARNRNQAIVCSIHQPSVQAFNLFDKVLLLSKARGNVGRVAYFGRTDALPAYLAAKGMSARENYSVADHIIELANANAFATGSSGGNNDGNNDGDDDNDGEYPADFAQRKRTMTAMPSEGLQVDITETWARSDEYSDLLGELDSAVGAAGKGGAEVCEEDDAPPRFASSFGNQVSTFTRRTFKDMVRGPDFFFARILKVHIVGFVVVTLFLQLDYSAAGIQNRVSFLFFSILCCFLLAQSYIPVLLVQRPLTTRERNSKLYSASAQTLGVMASQLPLDFINAIAFATYLYWGVGLRSTAEAYFQYMAVFCVCELLMVGIILCVSAVSVSGEQATIMASLVFMPLVLTLGFFVVDMPPWWSWVQWINPLYYSLQALLFSEFNGVDFECASDCETYESGDELLDFYDVDIDSDGGFWLSVLIVGCFALASYILLYFAIRFFKAEKR